jgi:serine/threonine protein kinase/tetratricopeptide (TPR) repeat protein
MAQGTLAPGTRLAQYEIRGRLGAGGMGEVYRAHDGRLDRPVAIKVLTSHLAEDPEMRARFEREARAVAALSHPSILSIHELALVGDLPFAVMELLEGESLRERIGRGPVPWRVAVELGAQAAEGLAAAHAKGIVHRDIKPENLFVLNDGRLKVLDFGLARSMAATPPDVVHTAPVVTQPGTLLGSIGYMAPEQVLGEAAGPAADIFALGCVIYEMVTGLRVFARDTPADSIAAILHASPPPMADRASDVPASLERVVAHCLAKAPSGRFSSARDVASALRALAVESAVSSTVPTRARKPRTSVRSVAVLPFTNSGAPEADYLADGLTEAVINSLAQVPRLRIVPRSTVFQYKGRDLDLMGIALALNVRSLVTGRVVARAETLTVQAELIDTATAAQVWGHQYRHAMSDVLAIEEEIAKHITEALSLRLSGEQRKRLKRRSTADTEAYHEYLRGRHQWGRWSADGFARAIEHFERAIDRDPAFALAWTGLADALIVAGYYGFMTPDQTMPRGLQAARRALDLDPDLAEAHAAMGFALLFVEWDWKGAEAALAKAVECNPRLAVGHAYQALLLVARRRYGEAAAAARRALDLEPVSVLMNQIRCWVLFLSGQYEAALAQARHVVDLDAGFVEAHSMVISCNELLGRLERAADEWALGLPVFGQLRDGAGRMKRALEARGPEGYWAERLALAREIPESAGGSSLLAQAVALVQLGRLDETVALLEMIVATRHPHAIFLAAHPFADFLREHAGFRTLLGKIGL